MEKGRLSLGFHRITNLFERIIYYMSMLLDVIVLAVLALTVFAYAQKGFAKSLLDFFGFILSLIFAFLAIPLLMPYLEGPITNAISGYDGSSGSLSDLLGTDFTAHLIAKVMSFTILFLLITVAVRIASWLIDKIFRLPVLKQANKLLGLLLGLVLGLFYAQLLSIFLFTFSELLISTQNFITREAFEGSVVARWMYDYNFFKLLF